MDYLEPGLPIYYLGYGDRTIANKSIWSLILGSSALYAFGYNYDQFDLISAFDWKLEPNGIVWKKFPLFFINIWFKFEMKDFDF